MGNIVDTVLTAILEACILTAFAFVGCVIIAAAALILWEAGKCLASKAWKVYLRSDWFAVPEAKTPPPATPLNTLVMEAGLTPEEQWQLCEVLHAAYLDNVRVYQDGANVDWSKPEGKTFRDICFIYSEATWLTQDLALI